MAYVLGFLFADGGISKTRRGTHFVSFYSGDKDLLENIRKVLDSEHKIAKRSARSGYVYRLQIGSKSMCKDLFNLGLVPNKTKRMKLPAIPKEYMGSFARGFFDGDGNVWTGYVNKSRAGKPTMIMNVAFTSASVSFLKDLLFLLRRCVTDLSGGSIYKPKNKNWGRLSFSTNDSLKLFEFMYNSSSQLFLRRKKRVFESFIKMRP